MSNQDEDKVLIRWVAPDFMPEFGFTIAKSAKRKRWTILLWLHTDEHRVFGVTDEKFVTYTYWLQFRCWWPPVMFKRVWVNWNT